MKLKNVKYMLQFIHTNKFDIPTFCKLCKMTEDTFVKILKYKNINISFYHNICVLMNMRLNDLHPYQTAQATLLNS